MSFLSSSSNFTVPYPIVDCLNAMKAAIYNINRFKIASENLVAMTMQVSVSPGLASTTWGDVIDIAFNVCPTGTTISITSTAKNFSPFGSGQQSKNIQILTDAFTNELEKYSKMDVADPSNSRTDRLTELKELYEKDLISREEYASRRDKILSEI